MMRHTERVAWLLLAAAGAIQLALLVTAIAGRITYPFDLEWMEGGLLHHAERVGGAGIYVPPSVEFIPYVYTPLYPAVLKALGSVFGLSYPLGRAISVLATLAVLGVGARVVTRDSDADRFARIGAALGMVGLVCAGYVWVEGWYDIVRGDMMFLAMCFCGLAAIPRCAATTGRRGHILVACAGAWLALAFFAKQTGIFVVAIGGALVLFRSWRKTPAYVAGAGAVGLTGTWLINYVTDGWFWTYVFEVPQSHDVNTDRVVDSFKFVLVQYPTMTVLMALGLVAAIIARRRQRHPLYRATIEWVCIFVATSAVGALSWGKAWAHFNAYLPALISGSIGAGLSLLTLQRALANASLWPRALVPASAVALAVQLLLVTWSPSDYIPTEADRRAGENLIATIAAIDGEVMVPFHPWYARMAGKTPTVHRMGIIDTSFGKRRWQIAGLREAFANHRFAAVVLDNRPPRGDFPGLTLYYRKQRTLSPDHAPRVFTGAGMAAARKYLLVPQTIWVPRTATTDRHAPGPL